VTFASSNAIETLMLSWHQSLLNDFADDTIHISLRHLLQLITARGWMSKKVFNIAHYATDASHYLVILDTGHPVCDCMMGTNLSIPCWHFYAVLRSPSTVLQFHLGLFNRR
jgi:hypothetical protein